MRLSPNIKIHIQGFELWHVYQFVPTLKVIAATIKSEISHFVIYSSTFCSLCQRMSNIIQILISQCPGSVILLCEPVMGEVRSLFWLEEMNLWYWTEGKSHWCFPQGGLWRLEGFFFSVFSGEAFKNRLSQSFKCALLCLFCGLTEMVSGCGQPEVGIVMRL